VWWSELSLLSKVLPAAFVAVYWPTLWVLHGLRPDHITMGCAILFLSYTGRGTRVLLRFLLPLLATGIIYDSMRFYSDLIRGPIHVEEPYRFDKRFFGISTAGGVLTPNEWCQLHTHWFLDLITGFAYLVFIFVFILTSAYFRFYASRNGTGKCSAQEVLRRSPAMMWSFLWVNLIGYSTYYWFAAAPPWYVAKYGLGPARLDVPASLAGCVRFDQLLGTHFFSEMYGRAADVFGAVPSLHVSYPLIAAYFAFRFGALRAFAVCFYLLMCFSAVYLNHHYLLDILWGSSYALTVAFVMDRIYQRKPEAATLTVAGVTTA
jgi:inositol phosphorylceramide synthase catalytic subunit